MRSCLLFHEPLLALNWQEWCYVFPLWTINLWKTPHLLDPECLHCFVMDISIKTLFVQEDPCFSHEKWKHFIQLTGTDYLSDHHLLRFISSKTKKWAVTTLHCSVKELLQSWIIHFINKRSSPKNILTIEVSVTIIWLTNSHRKHEKHPFSIAFDSRIENNRGKGNTGSVNKSFYLLLCLL